MRSRGTGLVHGGPLPPKRAADSLYGGESSEERHRAVMALARARSSPQSSQDESAVPLTFEGLAQNGARRETVLIARRCAPHPLRFCGAPPPLVVGISHLELPGSSARIVPMLCERQFFATA